MFHFLSTTGVGIETVDVTYDVDDGIVYGQEIKWQGKEISGLLSEDVNNEIELECYTDQRKREALEIANFNQDKIADMFTFRVAA